MRQTHNSYCDSRLTDLLHSITQEWCNTQQQVFKEDVYPFNKFGGMASMGKVGILPFSRLEKLMYNRLWLKV